MSFYSYKNAKTCTCPGTATGNDILNGLNKRVCIQVKNVYDACLQQEQLSDKKVVVSNIVPVLPAGCGCQNNSAGCKCNCDGNVCTCTCANCNAPLTHEEAVENAANATGPLPQPCGNWTFESCRSSTIKGNISNLSIERMCDRPQFARVKCSVDVPIDILFTDQRCQEWMGQSTVTVTKDVLLCVPEESIIPFTLESLVSAICVSGSYIGDCTFQITICVSVVLKVLAEVDIMVPTYGFCEIPPCEEFAESVCDEFFSLPLFPQSSCAFKDASAVAADTTASTAGTTTGCGCQNTTAGSNRGCGCRVSTCSSCGTTCASGGSICPRCGSTMTAVN